MKNKKCDVCGNYACTCKSEAAQMQKPTPEEKAKAQQEYSKLEKEYYIHMGMGYDVLRKIRVQLDNLERFLQNA
jgi:hypothetical protein